MLDNTSFAVRMQKTRFPEGGSMTPQMPSEKRLNYNRDERQKPSDSMEIPKYTCTPHSLVHRFQAMLINIPQ